MPHQKLTGKAKMLRIHIGASDTFEGEPLHDALIEKALPYLDRMVGNGLVAISDVDVILYKG